MVYVIIFLAALGAVGFVFYNIFVLEAKRIGKAFDSFIISDGFKWCNSSEERFSRVLHLMSGASLNANGQTVEIKQMICRDAGKYNIYLADVILSAHKAVLAKSAKLGVPKTFLYIDKRIHSDERIEIHRHVQSLTLEDSSLVEGAKAVTGGITPAFGSIFTITGLNIDRASEILNEQVQKIILSGQNHYPLTGSAQETSVYIDKSGLFITAPRSWNEDELKRLVNLGKEIIENIGFVK